MKFWESTNKRLVIWRHCDGVFELLHDGIQVMPISSFAKLCAYIWAEFPPIEVPHE